MLLKQHGLRVLCRLENVTLSCTYSRVKIGGTLLCVIGAFTMSISQSAASPPIEEDTDISSPFPFSISDFDKEKIVGCIYLTAAVFVLSSMVVLQVPSYKTYTWSFHTFIINHLTFQSHFK